MKIPKIFRLRRNSIKKAPPLLRDVIGVNPPKFDGWEHTGGRGARKLILKNKGGLGKIGSKKGGIREKRGYKGGEKEKLRGRKRKE